jgi:hypothetical protein
LLADWNLPRRTVVGPGGSWPHPAGPWDLVGAVADPHADAIADVEPLASFVDLAFGIIVVGDDPDVDPVLQPAAAPAQDQDGRFGLSSRRPSMGTRETHGEHAGSTGSGLAFCHRPR